MNFKLLIWIFFLGNLPLYGQDTYQLMTGRKLNHYREGGFFFNKSKPLKEATQLKKIRAFYKKNEQTERVVFDFSTQNLPKVMVYLSNRNKNLLITMENTMMKDLIKPIKTQMFSYYRVFQTEEKKLSAELGFKRDKKVDIFYLENPARLVIDVKVKK